MRYVIGDEVTRIILKVNPGFDNSWDVEATDKDGTPLSGSLLLTIGGTLILEEELNSEGVVTFSIPADTENATALISQPVVLAHLDVDLRSTIKARGVVELG